MAAIASKLRPLGNSIGVILPRDELTRLGIGRGDDVFIIRDADGLRLTPYDPEFARTVKAFERTKRKYRNALRELAR